MSALCIRIGQLMATGAQRAEFREQLRKLLLLQRQAFHALSREHFQQSEAFVQLAGRRPLTGSPSRAAHVGGSGSTDADALPLREPALPEAVARITTSNGIIRLTDSLCVRSADGEFSVRNAAQMTQFLQNVRRQVDTVDAKMHVLFLLDSTLKRDRDLQQQHVRARSSAFEEHNGYDLFAEWFSFSVKYEHEAAHSALSQTALRVLLRNVPALQTTRKAVVSRIGILSGLVRVQETKELLKNVIDLYQS